MLVKAQKRHVVQPVEGREDDAHQHCQFVQ